MSHRADVLIVTVTKVEGQAVIDVFEDANGTKSKIVPIGDQHYRDLGNINGSRVYMAITEMGSGGRGGSQESVRKGIEALSPSTVIMAGIAFGIDEKKQKIGEILVSKQLLLYELQRIGSSEIVSRGDKPHASPLLINWISHANLDWDDANGKITQGLILSGDKLVDNVDYRNQLTQSVPDAIGGEMEGAGLYVACENSKTSWILIKAICDFADGNKRKNKKARQELAAHNAASFVLHALQVAPLVSDGEKSSTQLKVLADTSPSAKANTSVPLSSESIEAASPEQRADTLVHLAFSTFGVHLDADTDAPICTSVCIVTDSPDRLCKQLRQIPVLIQQDSLVSAAAKKHVQMASLQQLVENPGARALVLRELAVMSFSAYMYYCPKEAFDKLPRNKKVQKLFIDPLIHRLSKKGERFDQVHARLADMPTYLDKAAKEVLSTYHRAVDVPQTGASKYAVLEELSALLAQACARHLSELENAETANLFENFRTRIRYAENVATGDKHKRNDNPLP